MYRKSVKASPASASHVNSPRTKYARPSTAQGAGVARVDLRAAPRPEPRGGEGRGSGRGSEPHAASRRRTRAESWAKGAIDHHRGASALKEPEIDCGSVRFPRPGPTMLRLDDPGQNGFGQRGRTVAGGGYVILTRMAKSHSFRIERSRTAARHNQYAATIDASDLCGRLLFVKDGAKGRPQTTRVGIVDAPRPRSASGPRSA